MINPNTHIVTGNKAKYQNKNLKTGAKKLFTTFQILYCRNNVILHTFLDEGKIKSKQVGYWVQELGFFIFNIKASIFQLYWNFG